MRAGVSPQSWIASYVCSPAPMIGRREPDLSVPPIRAGALMAEAMKLRLLNPVPAALVRNVASVLIINRYYNPHRRLRTELRGLRNVLEPPLERGRSFLPFRNRCRVFGVLQSVR